MPFIEEREPPLRAEGSGSRAKRRGPLGIGLVMLGVAALVTASVTQAATAVGLGTADSFAVLAGAGVTNTGPSIINGDLGSCPTPAITGFPPGIVNGTVHAADAVACGAQSDLVIAYNNAAGQAPTTTYGGPTNLGGQTLTPGVYKSPTSFSITGTLTLDGQNNPDSVFIFQAGSTLITAPNSKVSLINGAQACNVFWQVGSSATLGVGSTFVGTILALTSITANTNAIVAGRLLARNGAVTLDSNRITVPACAPTTTTSTTIAPTTSSTGPTTTAPGPTTSSTGPTTTTTLRTTTTRIGGGGGGGGVVLSTTSSSTTLDRTSTTLARTTTTLASARTAAEGSGDSFTAVPGGTRTVTPQQSDANAGGAPSLPRTGSSEQRLANIGGLAIALGALLVLSAYRRREPDGS